METEGIIPFSTDNYLRDRKRPTPAEEQQYLREVGFHCPLCGAILRKQHQKKPNKLYEIAHIYPNSPTPEQEHTLMGVDRLGDNSESFENKIALYKNCHEAQDYHTTKEDYLTLLAKKKECLQKTKLEDITEEMALEEDIAKIVHGICSLESNDFADLNYNPVAIEKKFRKSEALLKIKVSGYVTAYYTYIRGLFSEAELSRSNIFSIVSMEMKLCFIKLSEVTDNKSVIFQKMVEWIGVKIPDSSTEACEALISFFVQNCEVFNEISE